MLDCEKIHCSPKLGENLRKLDLSQMVIDQKKRYMFFMGIEVVDPLTEFVKNYNGLLHYHPALKSR